MVNRTELIKTLDNVFKDGDNANENLRKVLKEFNPKDLIVALANDKDWLEYSTPKSYEHVLGFDKIVIYKSAEHDYNVRLHVWWPNPSKDFVEGLHNHTRDFTSTIIAGEFTNNIYNEQPLTSENEFCKYQCFPQTNSDSYKIEQIAKVGIEKAFSATLSKGDVYFISHKTIHNLNKSGKILTATIMVQSKVEQEITTIYSKKDTKSTENKVVPMKIDELKAKMEKLAILI